MTWVSHFERSNAVWAVAVSALPLCACSTMEVTADHNPKVDFQTLRTWAFKTASEPPRRDPRLEGRRLNERIREQIRRRLEDRGYAHVDDGSEDFRVGYRVSIREALGDGMTDEALESTPAMLIMGVMSGPEPGSTRVFDEGALLIEFVDPQTGRMNWRAWTRAEVDLERSPEHNQRLLEEAVRCIVEEYPPDS